MNTTMNPPQIVATEPETPEISADYPHLFRSTAAMLDRPLEERTLMIHQDKFIMHTAARSALAAMKNIYNRPKNVVRPPCLAVIGNSNEGKTALVERFYADMTGEPPRRLGPNDGFQPGRDKMPIVLVEMPPRATEPRVCLAIARALNLTSYGTATKSRMVTDKVMRALVSKQVQMLILIEFQHVHPNPTSERLVVYDLIKGISNHGISVVAVGTENARLCLGEDEQVANRMRVVRLQSFAHNQEFRDFLHSLEFYYPLPKASGLGTSVMAKEIYARTNGIVGEVVAFCNGAAEFALKKKLSCIDLAVLKVPHLFPAANIP
jgi:hypothetical protein